MVRYSLTLVLGIVLYAALPQGVLALVNINSASLNELDSLPYVGTSTAELIIKGRPYSSSSDIQKVSGFGGGPGTRNYDAVVGLITVSGNTTVSIETSEKTTNSSSGNTTAKVIKSASPGLIKGLIINVPAKAYTGQLISFDVDPDDGKAGRLTRYQWNFGDGTTDNSKTPTHRYTHPGTYVVIVESYYQKETKLARNEIEILPLALTLEIISTKEVRVTNNGSYEIDLGRMVLIGDSTFTFPKHTILLPSQSLVTKVDNKGSVVLQDGEGVILATGAVKLPPTQHQLAVASTNRNVAQVYTQIGASSTEEVSIEEDREVEGVALVVSTQTASLPSANVPLEAWPYLGLFAVIGLGIFALYGTKS